MLILEPLSVPRQGVHISTVDGRGALSPRVSGTLGPRGAGSARRVRFGGGASEGLYMSSGPKLRWCRLKMESNNSIKHAIVLECACLYYNNSIISEVDAEKA